MAEFPRIESPNDFDAYMSLALFLEALDVQFVEVFDEPPGFLVPAEFYQLLRAAHEPVPPTIREMVEVIARREINLRPHALSGPPLAFKLNIVASQSRRFEAIKPQARRDFTLVRPARGIFKRLLERIDILLESLVASLPMGGLVVEFKKGLEHIVPDDFGENT